MNLQDLINSCSSTRKVPNVMHDLTFLTPCLPLRGRDGRGRNRNSLDHYPNSEHYPWPFEEDGAARSMRPEFEGTGPPLEAPRGCSRQRTRLPIRPSELESHRRETRGQIRCEKQFSQYTCPRCNIRYCSLPCYKRENKSLESEEYRLH